MMIPATLLYVCIGSSLIGEVPAWFLFLQAVCFFTYRVFDEMDGKQARRTQNGSPFGMVFDHGVDCIAAGLQPMIFARVIQVGDNLIAKLLLVFTCMVFHFVTIEHYYVGELILPAINGVSDGAVGIFLLCMYTAYVGNNWWATLICDGRWLNINGVEDLTLGQTMGFFVCLVNFLITLRSVKKVASALGKQNKEWNM